MFEAHKGDPIPTRTVRRRDVPSVRRVQADICVLGAGMSGLTAALEAARLGRRVVLADGAPAIGGQAVGSVIGTIIGLYTHGEHPYQITHGIADDLIREMAEEGALLRHENITVTFQYDEVRLGRWFERKLQEAGVNVLVGAILTGVEFHDRRVRHVDFATRWGPVRVEAGGYVDASGDASLSWEAGLDVREPEEPVFGTMNFLIEKYDTEAVQGLDMPAVYQKLQDKGADYGLVRHDGFLMHFPGKDFMLANISHFETPLDPLHMSDLVFEGRRQADGVLRFLRSEFPQIFKDARIRLYGNPGIRQTRWIVGTRQLTLDDIRKGQRPEDAVARCAWWVELHNTKEKVHWERFPEGHVYYIPLGCMTPAGADNIVATGRCVDADTHALSAVRVMGPCMAMGTAAAHALHHAGGGDVHKVNMEKLQADLYDNLERTD